MAGTHAQASPMQRSVKRCYLNQAAHVCLDGKENQALGGKLSEVTSLGRRLYGLITLSRTCLPCVVKHAHGHVGPICSRDQMRWEGVCPFILVLGCCPPPPGHHLRPKGCISPSIYTLWRIFRAFPPSLKQKGENKEEEEETYVCKPGGPSTPPL